jgi:hypothetical protein
MEDKKSIWQFTMTYGALMGVVSIILSLVMYMAGFMPFNFKRMILMAIIGILITVLFVVSGTKAYRDKVLDGSISYGKAVFTGMLIVVFATVLSSFYNLVFNLFIDPEYTGKMMEASKNWTYDFMTNMGAPEASIDEAMQKIEKQQANATPLKMFFQSLYSSVIFGLIIALITSAFIKKQPAPFVQE